MSKLLNTKLPIIILASLAFVITIVGNQIIFPTYSFNHDEYAYILQAKTLLHGKFWLNYGELNDFFQTWLEKSYNNNLVFKYTPVHASLLAAAKYVFNDFSIALGLIAFSNILLISLLSRTLGFSSRASLLAALFLLLSPLFLLQSMTYLSYCSELMLEMLFAIFLLKAVQKQSYLLMGLSGFILGLAFFARPFDALLFSFVSIFIVSTRTNKLELLEIAKLLPLGIAGFMPVLIIILIYNMNTTGNAFTFPFKQSIYDSFGFGLKRMYDGDNFTFYDIKAAIYSFAKNFYQFILWSAGGFLILIPVFSGFRFKDYKEEKIKLLIFFFIFPTGYFFFWGGYYSIIWKGLDYLGPVYYLPCLIPLVLLAALGFEAIIKKNKNTLYLLALMTLFSIGCFYLIAESNRKLNQSHAQDYNILSVENMGKAVIFSPSIYGPFLGHPYNMMMNEINLDSDIVYSVNLNERNFSVIDAFPNRSFYRFDLLPPYSFDAGSKRKVELTKIFITNVDKRMVNFEITNRNSFSSAEIYFANEKQQKVIQLDTKSYNYKKYYLNVLFNQDGVFFNKTKIIPYHGQMIKIGVRFFNKDGQESNEEIRYYVRLDSKKNLDFIDPQEHFVKSNFPNETGWLLSGTKAKNLMKQNTVKNN